MPLRSAQLTGDPVLEACLVGGHRMLAREQGLSVMRLQTALIDVGVSVGPAGADGIFGAHTGAAVTTYKTRKGLTPNDPVVGRGTAQALDDDLFRDPPMLDPAFAEFSPAVVDHRVEQFLALELNRFLQAPFDSWRRMLAISVLAMLNSGELLGIAAQSRAVQLRDRFLAVADPVQLDGNDAATFFDDSISSGPLGNTVIFTAGGGLRSFVVISDEVIRGRGSILRVVDGTRAPATLSGVLVHEVTHARNAANIRALENTLDTDTSAYIDTALAQARSATGTSTSHVLHSYVAELTARHVHWVVLQEDAGIPGELAIRGLQADDLAQAALFYFIDLPNIYDSNGYGAGINAQGGSVRLSQVGVWLGLCAQQRFSDDPGANQQSTLVFQAAAQLVADAAFNPLAPGNGVFPVQMDFR